VAALFWLISASAHQCRADDVPPPARSPDESTVHAVESTLRLTGGGRIVAYSGSFANACGRQGETATGGGTLVYQNGFKQLIIAGPGANVPIADDETLAGNARELVRLEHICVFSAAGNPNYNVHMEVHPDDGTGQGPDAGAVLASCDVFNLTANTIWDAAGSGDCKWGAGSSIILPDLVWVWVVFSGPGGDDAGWVVAEQTEGIGSTQDFVWVNGILNDFGAFHAGMCTEIYADKAIGRCCFGIGTGGAGCVAGVTSTQCNAQPAPRQFDIGLTCATPCPQCTNPGGPDAACNDGDACTQNICDTNSMCQHPLIPAFNDPANQCCNPSNGSVQPRSDGNECTADACSLGGNRGIPTHAPVVDGSPCGSPMDSDCDAADTCAGGVCNSNIAPLGEPCEDGNPCTGLDSCDGKGACVSGPIDPECQVCGNPFFGDCLQPQPRAYCSDATCCEAVCALPGFTYCCANIWDAGCAAAARSMCVPAGDDCWETECGRTQFDFCDRPIPADFFDPGSLPFDGLVLLGGSGDPSPDTFLTRRETMILNGIGASDEVPIELVELSLVSCEPITLRYSNGQADELWDVEIGLSTNGPPTPPGSINTTKTHDNGGTFDATFPVLPVFTFTKVGSRSTSAGTPTGDNGVGGRRRVGTDSRRVLTGRDEHLRTTIDEDAVATGCIVFQTLSANPYPGGGSYSAGTSGAGTDTLTLPGGSDQRVWVELFISNWGCTGGQMGTWQATYGPDGVLPVGIGRPHAPCAVTQDCVDAGIGPGSGAGCGGGVPNQCDVAFIQPQSAQPSGLPFDIEGCNSVSLACGGTQVISPPVADDGVSHYAMTVVLEVDAAFTGSAAINVQNMGTDTFFQDADGSQVPIGKATPLTINVPTGSCCNLDGTCTENTTQGACGNGPPFFRPGTACPAGGGPPCGAPEIRVLDFGSEGEPAVPFSTVGTSPWVHELAPEITLVPCGSNFVPGIEEDPQTLEQCCTETCHDGPSPGHKHCTKQCAVCPTGACCNPLDGSCVVTDGNGPCIEMGGQYKGDGTNCDDTDGDGIADVFETNDCCVPRDLCNTGTNPNNPDTDHDGADDATELANGTDPCVPDQCGLTAPPLPSPDGIDKNRYVGWEVPPDYDGYDRPIYWLIRSTDCVGFESYVGTPDPNALAMLVDNPVCMLPTAWPNGIHATGAPIVPLAKSYSVQAVDCANPTCISPPLFVRTVTEWGDVKEPFGGSSQPNFGDISGIVDRFRNIPTAPSIPQADLVGPGAAGQPNTPNKVVNFADISADVAAFSGFSFPYARFTSCKARDCFESIAQATITLDVNDVTCSQGIQMSLSSAGFDTAIVELDPPPYSDGVDINTEIVQMELAGIDPVFGEVIIRQRADARSLGKIEMVDAGPGGTFASGHSYFDVMVDVELPDLGFLLDTGVSALRLDAGTITALPPLSTSYFPPPSAPPVPLRLKGTTTQVGWLCHSEHQPTEQVPCTEAKKKCIYRLSCIDGAPAAVTETGLNLGDLRWKYNCVGTCLGDFSSTIQTSQGAVCTKWTFETCRTPQGAESEVPGSQSPACTCNCSVEISGPDLICNGSGDIYSTTRNPPGGTCAWSTEYRGAGRIGLDLPTCSVLAFGEETSSSIDDITIKVTYTTPAGVMCQDEKDLTVAQLQTTKIKFDHIKDDDKATADGLNIRKSYGTDAATDLTHTGNGVGNGEWVKGSNNEEVLYVANRTVTIKVRFTVAPRGIANANIKADAGGAGLRNVVEQLVAFDANGVSTPEFVEMSLDGNTPTVINKTVDTWNWTATRIDGKPVNNCIFDQSGPHTVYTVLDVPMHPWYQNEAHHPWVNALEFVVVTAGTAGKATIAEAASQTTTFVHSGHGLQYETTGGTSNYATDTLSRFNLTRFMSKANGDIVNCYDCAGAVATMTALVGGQSKYLFMEPFGYIKKTNLIGKGDCNNPFPDSATAIASLCVVGTPAAMNCAAGAACDTDCLRGNGRKRFKNHAFVELPDKIYDACAGPHLGTEIRADYFNATADKSSAGEMGDAGNPAMNITHDDTFDLR